MKFAQKIADVGAEFGIRFGEALAELGQLPIVRSRTFIDRFVDRMNLTEARNLARSIKQQNRFLRDSSTLEKLRLTHGDSYCFRLITGEYNVDRRRTLALSLTPQGIKISVETLVEQEGRGVGTKTKIRYLTRKCDLKELVSGGSVKADGLAQALRQLLSSLESKPDAK